MDDEDKRELLPKLLGHTTDVRKIAKIFRMCPRKNNVLLLPF